MQYYSTRNKNIRVGLEEGLKNGLAADKGLYMPEYYPVLSREEFEQIEQSSSLAETGWLVSRKLFGEDIPEADLKDLVYEALNFETPVVEVSENIYALELFHGPTLAFKDVGARFMARLLNYFNRGNDETVHVLVATSGDTGSAVANGFLGMEGIKVHVLYPSGQVSSLQEKQFTTLGSNIRALEIDGSFDDCQALVKSAFSDSALREQMILTSANSINLARFLPQSFYYFRAWAQVDCEELVIAVPSGNYGNLTAGLVAREMGLPVHTFLAASNANDVVPQFLNTGEYKPRASVQTIANAMDVGAPSNFERVQDIFDQKHERIAKHLIGSSYSDDEIREIIKKVYDTHGYTLDPHGATGYQAAKSYLEDLENGGKTSGNKQQLTMDLQINRGNKPSLVFLETAHPAKFQETVEPVIGTPVEIPDRLKAFQEGKKDSLQMSASYTEFKAYLQGIS